MQDDKWRFVFTGAIVDGFEFTVAYGVVCWYDPANDRYGHAPTLREAYQAAARGRDDAAV